MAKSESQIDRVEALIRMYIGCMKDMSMLLQTLLMEFEELKREIARRGKK